MFRVLMVLLIAIACAGCLEEGTTGATGTSRSATDGITGTNDMGAGTDTGTDTASSSAVVPEPGTALFLSTGLAAMAGYAIRKRKIR